MSKIGSFVFEVQELVTEMLAMRLSDNEILETVKTRYGSLGEQCAVEFLVTEEGMYDYE